MACKLYLDFRRKWASLVSDDARDTERDLFDREAPAVAAYWAMIEHRMFCELCREDQLLRSFAVCPE